MKVGEEAEEEAADVQRAPLSRRDGSISEDLGVRSSPPKRPKAAKTPATSTPAGKKASSKKAGAKEEAPAEAEGSMKRKKFSPRQTRAQRAAKAAGK